MTQILLKLFVLCHWAGSLALCGNLCTVIAQHGYKVVE